MFHRVREAGINFFDTADANGDGAWEKILGPLISDCGDEIVFGSKVFNPTGQDVNAREASRADTFIRGVETSLKRLRTDWLDFYFVHAFDVRTPIEQTVRALDDLQQQSKILYPALSNWAAWQTATALGISAREGLAGFELIPPMYNLVRRQAEVEILPWPPRRSSASSPTAPSVAAATGKIWRQRMVQIAPRGTHSPICLDLSAA